MPPGKPRRRRKKSGFDIVLVPNGEGGKTRRWKSGAFRLLIMATGACIGIVGVTLLALRYTPIALYFPIPNPALSRMYGQRIAETEERLARLTDEFKLLKDYNLQLRKALGEKEGGDSTSTTAFPLSLATDGSSQGGDVAETQDMPTQMHEDHGDFDLGAQPYGSIVYNVESFRAAFPLITPVEGFVSQGFDPARKHYGLDYATKTGAPVHAAAEGYVVFSGWTYEDGNVMIISHGGGYLSVYKHNQTLLKPAQALVKRGEVIATVGTTGNTSSGPHLHFEVWKDGLPQNPNEFLLSPSTIQ